MDTRTGQAKVSEVSSGRERSRPRIVFLFSDTGGGHRSAAEAIIEALELEYPGQMQLEMVDIFRGYAPPLLAKIPDLYPPLSRRPQLLGLIFSLSDGPRRTRLFLKMLWPFIKDRLYRLVSEHPADLYVSVHPLINAPLGEALERCGSRTPFLTVATDLVTTHATWFWKRSNRIIVPTEAALRRGVECGIPRERLTAIGLPVSERYCQTGCCPPGYCRSTSREEIRERLGWPVDRPVVLLMGGGEGSGPLERVAKAVDSADLPLAMAVVTGRNQALKARLEQRTWRIPAKVYGFVQEMPDFMRASDILLTKAGPGTISEALAAGLPMILYSRLNGPEDGNVGYVVENGAGVWAPGVDRVVKALDRWLKQPEERAQAVEACLKLARPRTARDIAREIAGLVLEQVRVPV